MQESQALIYIRKPGDPKQPFDISKATEGLTQNIGGRVFDDRTFVMIYSTWLAALPPIPVAFLIRLAARICAASIRAKLYYYKRRLQIYLRKTLSLPSPPPWGRNRV